MKLVTVRTSLWVGALSLAAGVALAAMHESPSATDQPPPAVNPTLGEEPAHVRALVQQALPQPRGQREAGTALVRPTPVAPQR